MEFVIYFNKMQTLTMQPIDSSTCFAITNMKSGNKCFVAIPVGM